MSDYRPLDFNPVDDIRFVLQSEVWDTTPELREAARAYADACRDVNKRLRRCDELLRRGLRLEAIQLAETEPNLLQQLAQLDFPERDDWLQAVAVYDLPNPEPLLVDVAQDLNAAYAALQPLQKLLERHRLLALARAPLAERIAVMREIARQDPDTPLWDEDIRTFEQERHREVEAEARQAAARKDLTTLRRLVQELSSPDWREPVPKSLVALVRQLMKELEKTLAREELGTVAVELERAFRELNLAAARPLRDRWRSLVPVAQLPQGDPLAEQIGPILGWIEDADAAERTEREFQEAVGALERALDRETPLPVLERLFDRVRKFERELPPLLTTRTANRLQTLRLSQTRLRRLQIGFGAAVLIGMGVLVAVVIQRQAEAERYAQLASAVRRLVDGGHLAEARQMLAGVGDVSVSESLAAVHRRLVEQERAEQERTTGLQAALRLAGEAASYDEAQRHLQTARPLARSWEEKLAVTELEQTWDARHREAVAQAEQQWRRELEGASTDLERLETLVTEAPRSPQTAALLADLGARLNRLTLSAASLRPELGSQAALLASRRQSLAELRDRRAREQTALEQVTERAFIPADHPDPASAVASFVQALEAYAESLGGDELANTLRQSASEGGLATAVLSWQQLKSSWKEAWPAANDELQDRLTKCQQLLQTQPLHPDAVVIGEYEIWLRAIAERNRPNDGLKARLLRLFSHHLIAEPRCLKTTTGRVYYLASISENEEFRVRGRTNLTIRYYVGFLRDPQDTRTQLLSVEDLASTTPFRPPQFALAQQVREQLPKLAAEDWESFLLGLAQSILASRELNDFLRFDLLKRVLEIARSGSPALTHPLAPHLQLLNDAAISPSVRWMDPHNIESEQAAAEARTVLKRLPPLEPVLEELRPQYREVWERVAKETFLVGWLAMSNGEWECRTGWRPESGQFQLLVLFPAESAGKGAWRVVGEADPQGLRIRSAAVPFLKQGRAVFAVPCATPTPVAQTGK